MQVLGYLISFFPLAVCLVGFFAFLLKKGKSYAQLTFMWAVFLLAVYYFAEGVFAVGTTRPYLLTVMDILSEFVTPALPVLFIAYVSSLSKNIIDSENMVIFLIPAAMLGIGELFIYVYLGMDQASAYLEAARAGDLSGFTHPVYSLANFWTVKLIEFFLIAEFIVFFVYLIITLVRHKANILDFLRFYFSRNAKGHKLDTYDSMLIFMLLFVAVYCVRFSIVGLAFIPGERYLSWTFSLVQGFLMINCIGLAYLPEVKGVTMRGLVHREFEFTPTPEALVPKVYDSAEYDKMSMNQLALDNDAQLIYMSLVQDKYYLDPDASLKGEAKEIGLSPRRINYVVATLCGCSYEQLLEYCRDTYNQE